ncbi:MAG: o-succinylbenzoate synthase [Bdellovibrionota bacterium]
MTPVRARLERFERPLDQPFRNAGRAYSSRTGAHLILETDRAVFLGEASPLPGFSRETADEAARELKRAIPAIENLAVSLLSTAALLEETGKLFSCPSARFAAETALLARAAYESGLPVARLLSSHVREEVPVSCVLPVSRKEETRLRIEWALSSGVRCFKVKAGPSEKDNAALLLWIRKELPEGIRLRVDANGCWNTEEALQHIKALAPFDLEYVEQPVAAETSPDAIGELCEKSPVPVALDESACFPEAIELFLDKKIRALFILKPAVLGGVAATLKAARLIHAQGAEAILSSSLDGAVGRRMNFEIACALPFCIRPAGLWTTGFSRESESDNLELRSGSLFRRLESLQEHRRALGAAI